MDLLDLKSDQCRYPSGTAVPYDFCGAATAPGATYCTCHARLCLSPKAPKDWRGLAGMIAAVEETVTYTPAARSGDSTRVSPIDRVFAEAASALDERSLLDRVL